MISSLLHLDGLRPRVYYTLTNFRGGGKAPLAPPSIRQWLISTYKLVMRDGYIEQMVRHGLYLYIQAQPHIVIHN